MIYLFEATLVVSSALLFLVQPMFAKMVLPSLGGSPSVWNVCVFFYQFSLLMGYLFAYFSTTLKIFRQIFFHLLLLSLAALCLPIEVPKIFLSAQEFNPIIWLLLTLSAAVGLPFLAVSASGITIQRWFSYTGHSDAQDPYFLFRYSNIGSLLGLLGYPLLVEPHLTLKEQSLFWMYGYGLLIVLTMACACFLIVKKRDLEILTPPQDLNIGVKEISFSSRLKWIALAFVPSSLMLSVTGYLSSDISPFPLLWVIPLAIYLFTFVLTFGRKNLSLKPFMIKAQPILLVPLVLLMITQSTRPAGLVILFHLLTFFVIAMVFHGELAALRPSSFHLAEFYIWIAVGGTLGGLFNGIFGPLVFSGIAEYSLTLILACLLAPGRTDGQTTTSKKWEISWPDIGLPVALGFFSVAMFWIFRNAEVFPKGASLKPLLALPAALCFLFSNRPLRFGLGLAGLMCAGLIYAGETGSSLLTKRSFFGVHKVVLDPQKKYHWLVHGVTVHGGQSLEESRVDEPLAYYHPTGPIGQIFSAMKGKLVRGKVAVVGLGTGSMAAYAQKDSEWTFYEIDPVVEQIARDKRYFTFLERCEANYHIIIGDARRTLVRGGAKTFSLIVLDAFGSSSVPIHLLTEEALQLYLSKLTDDGVLAFHVTSRHLQLDKILGDLSEKKRLFALEQEDVSSEEENENGKFTSRWIVMARNAEDLGILLKDSIWKPLTGRKKERVWSDDFSNVMEVLSWD